MDQEREKEEDMERARPRARDERAEVENSRGKRITADWKPKPETIAWARGQGVDAVAVVEEFVEYWRSLPGAKGRRVDWDLTFKNRLRGLIAQGRAPKLPPEGPPPVQPEPDALTGEQAAEHIAKLQLALGTAGKPPWET
jgi:hypothetical protein